jgi:signal transduction histidine kinase
MTILAIALAEIVAMAALKEAGLWPYWLVTLIDAAIMVIVAFPVLWFLVFRPLSRLLEERREREVTLRTRTGELEVLAVERSALFQAEQRAREQAETLRSASLAITRSLDLEAVFTALLEHLGRLVPYDRAKVMLLETDSRLKVRAVFTPSGALDFVEKPFDSFDAEENKAVGEVLASRRSICIGDTSAQPGWGAERPGVERSWLGVPLLAGGEAIGLYTLVKAEPEFFTPERINLVEALYAPASVAIANARLFEEVRSGRMRLEALSRKLVEAQEAERRRVARELHDEAGQLLSSLTVGLRLLEHEAERPKAVFVQAANLRQIAHAAQESLHRLATDLRPAALDHLGLVPALGQLAAKLSGTGGPAIHLETLGFDGKRLSPDLDIALYRIAQEALTNAVRHARARQVSLVVERREKGIVMLVEDDGRGFDVESAVRSGRLGLPGIRERAEMLGGKLLIESSPGSGTTLVVEVPHAA